MMRLYWNLKMFRNAKKDDNHNEVVLLFNKLGWVDLDISQLKRACDVFICKPCGKFLVTIAVEIKDGKKPPSQRKLTTGEQEFKDRWRGYYEKVETLEDVVAVNKKYMSLII